MPYIVTLSNGAKIENLSYNGSCFETQQKITPDMFTDGLSPVIVSNGVDPDIVYKNACLIYVGGIDTTPEDDDETLTYLFRFDEVTNQKETEGIKFLAENLLSDEQAAKAPFLFDDWDPNDVAYTAEVSKVRYNGLLYKCLQSHTSQISWNPKDANSLWVRIDDPAEEWPEWRQPEGAHDAYAKGAKVTHNEKHWISDVDNNVWEPGVYGWTESPIETEGTA